MDCRDLIQQSLDYIEENLTADIDAQELAQAAGFSVYHYYRLFRSATGMSVMHYILRRRLLHAIFSIRCGSTGIDAALKYGFDTYPGFYRAFRREFGCTPSAFLKANRARRPWRINLKQEAYMNITRKRISHVLKHWNLEQESVADVYCDGTGNQKSNAFYVGDAYVLKATANLGKLLSHVKLTEAIDHAGLQAPAAIPTPDGKEYVADGELYFYLTRRLPGEQISAPSLYKEDPAGGARFIGRIIGQLHLALGQADQIVTDENLLQTLETWALPRAAEVLGLSAAFCRDFLCAFRELYPQLPRQIIHRDPNPSNIICREGRWGFLDFELSCRDVRIFDPCYAATAILSESFGTDGAKWTQICRELLEGYDSVIKLTPDERRAVPYVILANQFVCVAWFAEQEQYAQLLQTNIAMTKWLMAELEGL